MNCLMFPGQPLSRGTSFPDDADFAEILEMVRSVARLDLETFRWLAGEGTENVKLQLLGVAESLHRLRSLRRRGIRPELITQHSMGIYPALVACGSIREEEAVEMTWRVGLAIAAMARRESYALGCVIGLTLRTVLALARKNGAHMANHNTSRHFLLSGKKEEIASAVAEAMETGAFSVRTFDCDAPLHTPLMAPIEQELCAIFSDYRYRDPDCPLMNHLDQRYLTSASIPSFMVRELRQPVYWERTYRALRIAGADTFHEVGAGDSLKKYNRWIEAEIGV